MIYIIDPKDVDNINFDLCLETSKETLQFSLNREKTYISANDSSVLGNAIPLEIKSNYDFTRESEWWRVSNYA